VALHSVDPNARKQPKMRQVMHIIEAEDTPPYSKKYVSNSTQNSLHFFKDIVMDDTRNYVVTFVI
jgi:hypothetical protein